MVVLLVMLALAGAGSGAVAHAFGALVHAVLIAVVVLAGLAVATVTTAVVVRRRRRAYSVRVLPVRPLRVEVAPGKWRELPTARRVTGAEPWPAYVEEDGYGRRYW